MFGVVLQIKNHNFQWPWEDLNYEPLTYLATELTHSAIRRTCAIWLSGLGNCLACKKFVTQILPFSLKLVILKKSWLQDSWVQSKVPENNSTAIEEIKCWKTVETYLKLFLIRKWKCTGALHKSGSKIFCKVCRKIPMMECF